METLILGWYVLVETESVLLLTLFASLQYLGTLLAPIFGVLGHRLGNKKVLCAMRATYTTLATTLMTFALLGVLSPVHVFAISALMGLVRPSDLVMRYALVGETVPSTLIVGATSVSRTTQDSARLLGALAGAGLVAALGIAPAYAVITVLYASSFVLTLRVGAARAAAPTRGESDLAASVSPWRDLREAAVHIWTTPQLLGGVCLAFLINLTAFPLIMGLLPYVAKEIYGTGQTGLGYLVASFASGSLAGSIALSRYGRLIRPGRMMLVFCAVWHTMLLLFAWMPNPAAGMFMLVLTGFAQSLCTVPLSALLLRNARDQLRGRIMGIRMLAIYGVPVGLLVAGPLIRRFSYPVTVTLYAFVGLTLTVLIALHWRAHLWKRNAPANTR